MTLVLTECCTSTTVVCTRTSAHECSQLATTCPSSPGLRQLVTTTVWFNNGTWTPVTGVVVGTPCRDPGSVVCQSYVRLARHCVGSSVTPQCLSLAAQLSGHAPVDTHRWTEAALTSTLLSGSRLNLVYSTRLCLVYRLLSWSQGSAKPG